LSQARKGEAVRILFIYKDLTTFVRDDLEILADAFQVTPFRMSGRIQPAGAIVSALRSHDAIFCWFASWHSLLPVLGAAAVGLPTLIAAGGYDTANLPEIAYGHQRGGLRKWVSGTILRKATRIIAASEYSRKEALEIAGVQAAKVSLIHHGFRDVPVPSLDKLTKERMALTIGNIDRKTLWRKGIEPFVRAGSLLPSVELYAVGRWHEDAIGHLRAHAAPNVHFSGYLPDDALRELRLRAKLYVQASMHEAFGMAVAESMLHYCVPVVTRAGALPEVVGEAGYYTQGNQPQDVAQAIGIALEASASMHVKARERVLDCFPFSKRKRKLVDTVREVMEGQRCT